MKRVSSLSFVLICCLLRFASAQSTSPIVGYTDKIGVAQDDSLSIMISSTYDSVQVTMTRFGASREVEGTFGPIATAEQPISDSSWKKGCNWLPTIKMKIPSTYRSGMYAAVLTHGSDTAYATFIVRPRQPGLKRIAVIASTNTWNAYNDWGGASFYVPEGKYSSFVSYIRPNPGAIPYVPAHGWNHLAGADQQILAWLEGNGFGYDSYTDVDLHRDSTFLKGYRYLVIGAHPEYYSSQMLDNVERFLESGGSLIYLGGNGFFWKVTLDSTLTVVEVHKNGSRHVQTGELGGHWSDLGRPAAKLSGEQYDSRGYMTFAPYVLVDDKLWIFSGTNLHVGDLFGFHGTTGDGASGWETDKINPLYSPPNLVVIAKGTNPDSGGADMVYFRHPGGGFVFSAGSINFVGALANDQHISTMMKNIFIGDPNTVPPDSSRSVNSSGFQIYPNPFNSSAIITFRLLTASFVRTMLYDALGRQIAVLFSGECPAGTHNITLDGSRLSSGVYYCRIQTSNSLETRKLICLK